MPKLGTYGSVRGAPSNGCPYRDWCKEKEAKESTDNPFDRAMTPTPLQHRRVMPATRLSAQTAPPVQTVNLKGGGAHTSPQGGGRAMRRRLGGTQVECLRCIQGELFEPGGEL